MQQNTSLTKVNATSTDSFIDEAKSSLIRTYLAHTQNPTTIRDTQQRTERTDILIELTDSFIKRTTSAIARFIETVQTAYARFNQQRKRQEYVKLEAETAKQPQKIPIDQNNATSDSKTLQNNQARVVADITLNNENTHSTLQPEPILSAPPSKPNFAQRLREIETTVEKSANAVITNLKINTRLKAVLNLQGVITNSHKLNLLNSYAKEATTTSDEQQQIQDTKQQLLEQILAQSKLSVTHNDNNIPSSERLVIVQSLQTTVNDVIKQFEPEVLVDHKKVISSLQDSMQSLVNTLGRSNRYRR